MVSGKLLNRYFLFSFPYFRNSRKERVQAMGAVISGIVGWTSVGYDWSMVVNATINQS